MRTTRNLLWCAMAAVLLLAFPVLPVWGQNTNTGEIKGAVTDPSGAAIANATVTICHSKTADLPGVCREADILVAAIGRPAAPSTGFNAPAGPKAEEHVTQLLELYSRCLKAVEGQGK